MSLFTNKYPDGIDRTPKTREAADNLKTTQIENFTIYILKGIHSRISCPSTNLVSFKIRQGIQKLCEEAIKEIKEAQQIRRITRKVRGKK